MIENVILTEMNTSTALKGLVSKICGNAPAFFSEQAPENVKFPYIILATDYHKTTWVGIHEFNVYFHIYDDNTSYTNIRDITQLLEFMFDYKIFNDLNNDYSYLRFFLYDRTEWREEDPRITHYILHFTVRACRKAWVNQL